MFGGFGSSSNTGGFGANNQQQQQPGQSLFGSTNQTNTGFGGFGVQQQPQQQSAFGAPATGFGQPQQQTSAFGSTNTGGFGANTSAFGQKPGFGSTPGVFGSTTTQQPTSTFGGGFGSTNTTGFGSATGATSGGLFGAKPTTTSAFGAPAMGTTGSTTGFGGFGSTGATSTSAFGQTTTTGGMFGGSALGGGTQTTITSNQGTGNPSYQVTQEKESNLPGSGVTNFQAVSAMAAYKNWSFEELRVQDYMMNKKFAGAAPGGAGFPSTNSTSAFGGTTSTFGAPAQPTNTLFGGASTSQPSTGMFGSAPSTSGFGATQPTAFGSTGGSSLFGQQTTNTAGAFGTQQPQQQQSTFGGFGQQPPKPAFGGFGQQPAAPSNAFGATTTTAPATGGLFGQQPANTTNSLFGKPAGAPATTGFGGFGQPATTQPAGGLFGQPASTTPATGMFGQPATSTAPTGGLFGNNAAKPAFGGFGQTTTSTAPSTGMFGAGTTQPIGGGSLFGQPQTQPGATGFGTTGATTGGLFGTTVSQPGQTSLFGQTPAAGTTGTAPSFGLGATQGTSLFGNAQKPAFSLGGTSTASSTGLFQNPAGASTSLFQAPAPANQSTSLFNMGGSSNLGTGFGQLTQQQPTLQASIDKNPYGYNPLLQPSSTGNTNASAPPPLLSQPSTEKKKPALAPNFKVTPRTASKIKLRGMTPTTPASAQGRSLLNAGGTPGPRRLTGPTGSSATPDGKSFHLLDGSPKDSAILGLDSRFTPRRHVKRLVIDDPSEVLNTPRAAGGVSGSATPLATGKKTSVRFDPTLDAALEQSFDRNAVELKDVSEEVDGHVTASQRSTPQKSLNDEGSESSKPSSARKETVSYTMEPPLKDLLLMSDEDLHTVENFKISLEGVGSVRFLEPVDLLQASPTATRAGIELIAGNVVILEPKLCTVYPDEDLKPPMGLGLNVKAEITLDGCWPVDKATRRPIIDPSDPRHDRHMRKLENMQETKFVGFNNHTGTWRFKVEHFSRYGLLDDDESGEDQAEVPRTPTKMRVGELKPILSTRKGKTPTSTRRVRIQEPDETFLDVEHDDDEFAHTVQMEAVDASQESSFFVEDSFSHIIRRKQHATTDSETKTGSRLRLAVQLEDDSDDVLEEGQEESYLEEDDEVVDLSQEEDDEFVEEEEEDGPGSAVLDVMEEEDPAPPMVAAFHAATPHLKRMDLSRKVQGIKASLFRSGGTTAASSNLLSQPIPAPSASVNALFGSQPVAFHMDKIDKRSRETQSRGKSPTKVESRSNFELTKSEEQKVPQLIQTQAMSPHKYLKREVVPEIPQSLVVPQTIPYRELVPYDKSILSGHERTQRDHILFMSRSFRVGWGHVSTFISTGRSSKNGLVSTVCIQRVELFDQESECQVQTHRNTLDVLLKHTTIPSADGGIDGEEDATFDHQSVISSLYPSLDGHESHRKVFIPKASLSPRLDFSLLQQGSLSSKTGLAAIEHSIWMLSSALWDPISVDLSKAPLSGAMKDGIVAAYRKEKISQWLAQAINHFPVISSNTKRSSEERIFDFLTRRSLVSAMEESISTGNLRMASIIAQIGGPGSDLCLRSLANGSSHHGVPGRGGTDGDVLADLSKQVDIWNAQDQKKDGLVGSAVSATFKAIYSLIGGNVEQWNPLVFSKDLDWKRAFGVFFWYGDGGSWSLDMSLDKYREFFSANASIPQPLPLYLVSKSSTVSSDVYYDLCYGLLNLFARPDEVTLEEVLEPGTWTSNVLDVRLTWVIGVILRKVKGVTTFKDVSDPTPDNSSTSPTADLHTLAFISQLEHMRLWKWAIFVSLFLEVRRLREKVVRDLLAKWYPFDDASGSWKQLSARKSNVKTLSILDSFSTASQKNGIVKEDLPLSFSSPGDNQSETYHFLVNVLKVPAQWIHESRALAARNAGNEVQELISLIDAKHYGKAHALLMTRVAPKRIVNGRFALLKAVLGQFPEHSVNGWTNGGSFLQQYISIIEHVEPMLSQLQETMSLGESEPDSRSHVLDTLVNTWAPLIKSLIEVLANDYISVLLSFVSKSPDLVYLISNVQQTSSGQGHYLHVFITRMTSRLVDNLLKIRRLVTVTPTPSSLILDSDLLLQLPLASDQQHDPVRSWVSDWL